MKKLPTYLLPVVSVCMVPVTKFVIFLDVMFPTGFLLASVNESLTIMAEIKNEH